MTDADLMDADCIHGIAWYECKECELAMNTDLMGGLGVPFAVELDPAELELLQFAIADRLGAILMRYDVSEPHVRERYDRLVALGRKLGMEL